MRRRRKNKKQVKVVIGLSICLLLIMTVGYAAFSTNLTLSAKGNIVSHTSFLELTKKLVTSGDGLYKDAYEDDKYTYRGLNVDNYVKFNNTLWRILSINSDGTAKIITDKSIDTRAYDIATGTTSGPRYNEQNTYCQFLRPEGYYAGCYVWAKANGNFNGGTVTLDSSINTYLNTTYYNGLSEETKKYIQIGPFYFNGLNDEDSIAVDIDEEKKFVWNGKIGLITPTEYLRITLNADCINIKSSYTNAKCGDDNYLFDSIKASGENFVSTISGRRNTPYHNFVITNVFNDSDNYQGGITGGSSSNEYFIRPVVFIKSDVMLIGSGTKSDPYVIK